MELIKKFLCKSIECISFLKTKKQFILVMDLDETMISTVFISDCKFNIRIRPYLTDFLNYCNDFFDIYVYTASIKQYADVVIDKIENDYNVKFKGRYYRSSCTFQDNVYMKNISIIAPSNNIKDILVIDDNKFCYGSDQQNVINITKWTDDIRDDSLKYLIKFLEESDINSFDDMRVLVSNFNKSKYFIII